MILKLLTIHLARTLEVTSTYEYVLNCIRVSNVNVDVTRAHESPGWGHISGAILPCHGNAIPYENIDQMCPSQLGGNPADAKALAPARSKLCW